MALQSFHPLTTRWFTETLGAPTEGQRRGWEAIRQGRHTLIAAPTGSGKTLAAFLIALDDLLREGLAGRLADEVRVVYVSPLKALSADIHKNLAQPRAALRRLASDTGLDAPRITAAVRTGDTPAAERAAMVKTPPHVLVTTPESLYLLLTAERSREILRTVRTVIVDELHAVIGTRRGAHLALSLERLAEVTDTPPLRIGLSATQHPIDEVARYLVGTPRVDAANVPDCAIVDTGHRRDMDIALELPSSPLEAVMAHEVWEEYYDRLAALIGAHRTTLVFVNTRRLVERVARDLAERLGEDSVAAHHGSLSKERRLDAEERLKTGRLKALVATASLELGIDIGHVDLVCQLGSPRRIATFLQRVGRAGHTLTGTPKGRLFPISRDDLVECAAILGTVRRGRLDRLVPYDAPLDVLAQQVVAECACTEYREDDLFSLIRRAWPYRQLERTDFDSVVRMLATGFTTRRGRRSALIHRDEVNRRVLARRGARLTAVTSGGAIPENADYRVLLDPEETFIGTVNEDWAIESMAGDIFQLGNSSWRILRVASGVVHVEDAHGAPPTIPFWLGEAPGRSAELSSAVSDLRGEVGERLLTIESVPVQSWGPPLGGPSPASFDDAQDSPEQRRGAIAGPEAMRGSSVSVGRTETIQNPAVEWLVGETGISQAAAEQIVAYFADAHRMLGVLPTQKSIVLERFFDESGGMQLVLHAPFGSRINRAWGLALRKRFCRQFNFELQAAATEEGLLLSLGPQHSFPLADVFRYLHPATVRDVLIQAFLDAPVFQTRWRWNTTISLAVPRNRRGKKVPAPLQRMMADDLLASAFPDAAACLENIPGDREIPDHPLVQQTVRDCLEEAMDLPQLVTILQRIHGGEIQCVARDTTEPSPLSHEILSARPYAYLDDAPLEERRAQAVYTRRATDPSSANELGRLDADAVKRVQEEAWLEPRDRDELHDGLVTTGFLTEAEAARQESFGQWLQELGDTGRVTLAHSPHWPEPLWVPAERLPELLAVVSHSTSHPTPEQGDPTTAIQMNPMIVPPAERAARSWTREEAILELVRSRIAALGPVTWLQLAAPLGLTQADVELALLALENEGVVLRGSFTPGVSNEWCERRLLARIHRYTLNRLRAEIEPVTPADYMRFLFSWQHVAQTRRLNGLDGLRAAIAQLDGFEAAAGAWERHILPTRIQGYEPALLDQLCFTGEVAWSRLSVPSSSDVSAASPRPVRSTPIALFLRQHASTWRALSASARDDASPVDTSLRERGRMVMEILRKRGAVFAREIAAETGLEPFDVQRGLAELVATGLVTSDGFGGLRAMFARGQQSVRQRTGWQQPKRRTAAPIEAGGRWSLVEPVRDQNVDDRSTTLEFVARALLQRYGVVFRRLLARETRGVSWRELTLVYRRLEARGEIRGGRFVSGLTGEQFALPDAVTMLREIRRTPSSGELMSISTADPLNLVGIVTGTERVAALARNRIVFRDGVPLAALEGDYVRTITEYEPSVAGDVARALTGRSAPAIARGFVGA